MQLDPNTHKNPPPHVPPPPPCVCLSMCEFAWTFQNAVAVELKMVKIEF